MRGAAALAAASRRTEAARPVELAATDAGPPPDKTLGEFSELLTNYEGSFRPARVGLRLALDAGKMRDPLRMPQSAVPWSDRRPRSAGSSASGGGAPSRFSPGRAGGLSRTGALIGSPGRDQQARPGEPGWDVEVFAEREAAEKALRGAMLRRDVPLLRAAVDKAGHCGVDAKVIEQARKRLAEQENKTEKGPGVLQPQRIELPSYLNTPTRRLDGDPGSAEERTQTLRRIQDLELLTSACKRASKGREEGRAHFALGVLRDNLGQHQKAIDHYNNFLRICKECNDMQGCALAYHCIAVGHQLIGEKDLTILRKAIFYHNKHRETSDAVGKFVAHLNMGLAYAKLGEREASTVNHQYALRYALQLHSQEGQSLAIGSMGFSIGMYDNDPEKMRLLIERYIELCDALKQPRNQAMALRKLGIIASQQGDSEQSIGYFQQAIDAAKAQGDGQAEKECSVRLGIAAGQARMAEHLGGILQRSIVSQAV